MRCTMVIASKLRVVFSVCEKKASNAAHKQFPRMEGPLLGAAFLSAKEEVNASESAS